MSAIIGSWTKHPDEKRQILTYRRVCRPDQVEYLTKELRYTHIELIGISEHPFLDGSWGYQGNMAICTRLSRYGTPNDFMYMESTSCTMPELASF